jgi:hypothetical protein
LCETAPDLACTKEEKMSCVDLSEKLTRKYNKRELKHA